MECGIRKRGSDFLEKQVLEYIKRHNMVEPGDHLAVGVSGGADSVCLLLVLDALRDLLPFSMTVVHVEHGFRGQESLADASFVENLCKERGLPFRMFSVNMEELARAEGISLEEAGRKLRYQCFLQVCREQGANKIAVAHHRDDQAETVLMHLFRGAGLKGLCGMAPVRSAGEPGILVIRPLLDIGREDIEQWLREQGISWRTDATNEETVYTRNMLRLQVLPLIESKVQTGAGAHIAQTAERLSQVWQYLDAQAALAYDVCVCGERSDQTSAREICIRLTEFGKLESLMKTMVLQQALENLEQGLQDITAVHLQQILELSEKETGKMRMLPRGICARREYDRLILEVRKEPEVRKETEIFGLSIPGTYRVGEDVWKFSLENAKKCMGIPEKTYTKWFDYDRIIKCLSLRTRKPGDFLEINEAHGKKKLKDYFIDCKVPREERDSKLLLAEGNHVLWVPGMRISEAYKVTEQTKSLLKVELFRRTSDEGKDSDHDSGK